MFPLGTVLLPGAVLPMRVFEPRYQRLLDDVLPDSRRFGVVLIERGSEVGGGDVRAQVGTVAEIARAEPVDDGTWKLVVVGEDRFEVEQWLPDDPYPRARVRVLEAEPAPTAEELRGVADAVTALSSALAAAGMPGPTEAFRVDELDERARRQMVWWAVSAAHPGPLDAQRVLAAPDQQSRIAAAVAVVRERTELIRLGLDGP